MKIGYKGCRGCGAETNCADLVSGFCPACARAHAMKLSEYQRQYQQYVEDGHERASAYVAEIIRAYQQSEGVRLKDVPAAYQVR